MWVAALLVASLSGGATTTDRAVREAMRERIEAAGVPSWITVRGEHIHASESLPAFYEQRGYEPAWSAQGRPLPRAEALLRALHSGRAEGLRPRDYHLARIEAVLGEPGPGRAGLGPGALVDLDLLLTDAFLVYAGHLLSGRVNPETRGPEWISQLREGDVAAILASALEADHIEGALAGLLPPHPGYARLRQELARLRDMHPREWPAVPPGPKLERGARAAGVAVLRVRLAADGDLGAQGEADPESFDEGVEAALRSFQRRHGLDPDGVVGPATLAALNVPLAERLRQIEVNMERWRWLPQDLGRRHILVNIASFELDVFEDGRAVLVMRAVVGRPYRRTPVFSDRMTYLVFSPYWDVPPGIAARDVLPAVRKDPAHLGAKNMRVFDGWGPGAREVDPASVDWSQVTARNLRYRFRQDPGPANALGRVKFMFPNKFSVYLHDTPRRELFARTSRDFSSGCIRLDKPLELAEYLLASGGWTRERILAAVASGVEQTVRLPEPIPVHLLYWTAWATEDGTLQFRRDIYDRDAAVARALHADPPEP